MPCSATSRFAGGTSCWRPGARPRRLGAVPPAENVHHLRGLDDATALRADLERGGRLVIVGAGFVGAEVASSARALGADVTIVESLPVPFAGTLGPSVGRRLADRYRADGVNLRLGVGLTGIEVRRGRAESVRLADGDRLRCDALLVAVGARPATEIVDGILAPAADGGLPTDANGATEAPGVHACGDVASPWRPELGRHCRLEHWTAASIGGATVARAIMGQASSASPSPYFWSDQFGWRLQMVGHAVPGPDGELEEREGGFVARYRDRGGAVSAALAVNRPGDLVSLRAEVTGSGAAAAAARAERRAASAPSGAGRAPARRSGPRRHPTPWQYIARAQGRALSLPAMRPWTVAAPNTRKAA